jgi:enamine deaminase RidA (YjgF/YER057c/UK114 family)
VKRVRYETDAAPPSTGFRSQALAVAGYLFTGGQIGAPLEGGNVRAPAATLEAQVALCLGHLSNLTRAANGRLDRVCEVSAFVVPAGTLPAVRSQVEAYLGYAVPLFNGTYVQDVAMHGLIELDWIVALDDSRSLAEAAEVLRPFGHGEALKTSGPFIVLNGLTGSGADMREQSESLLEHAARALEQRGRTLKDLLKLTVYLREFDLYPAFNEVTKARFADFIPPTRSVVVAPEVTGDALIRTDALALGG